MTADSGVFTIRELIERGWLLDEIKRAQRRKKLISPNYGWVQFDGADPRVVSAVRAGGALTCVCALNFHQKHGYSKLWIPPGHSQQTHVRLSKHKKSKPRSTGPFHWCQGYGQALPVVSAVDSIPMALGCAARCMTAEEWIATVDSVLNSTTLTVPDIQAGMGRVSEAVKAWFARCDPRSQSGTESVTRLRLIAEGFNVVVQPQIADHHQADLRIGALVIECDGRLYHSDEESYRNDRARDRVALIGRWLTMRLTYDDVLYDWDQVLEDIRAVTRAGRHRIRRKNDPRLA